MASAIDDAGFEVRDLFMWLYTQNQVKAMAINHFIEKMDAESEAKKKLMQKFAGWKTPQVKSCFEPIVLAQKPTDQTYLQNMIKHEVGLINTNVRIGDSMYPANVIATDEIDPVIDKVFLLPKPNKQEKGEYNDHKTVKPLLVCEYLIRLSAFAGEAVVLDPFIGSGTTAVAAKRLGKHFIGIELNEHYAGISERRIKEAETERPEMDIFGNSEVVQMEII